MKRFLVFCVAIIVTVSLGFMVYYFTLNNEYVSTPQTVYTLNVGDAPVSFEIEHKNPKSDTKISFAYEKEGIVKFDLDNQLIEVLGEGSTRVTLQTTNKDIPVVYIDVTVGGGTASNPFFIRNEKELAKIGATDSAFKLDNHYLVVDDITLPANWTPIGAGSTKGFTGTFNGNFHTISNLRVSGVANAGLFEKVGEVGQVLNLDIVDVELTGVTNAGGAITAINNGTIRNCAVGNMTANTTTEKACIGGIAGRNESLNTIASIYKCSANVSLTGGALALVGGITGISKGAEVVYCYVDRDTLLTVDNSAIAGGLVGLNTFNASYGSIVAGSYALGSMDGANTKYHGGVVGYQVTADETDTGIETGYTGAGEETNKIYGNYYLSTGYGKGIGNYDDCENAISEPENIDAGIYGCEGADYNTLCTKETFKLFRDISTDQAVAWNFKDVWTLGTSGTPKHNRNGAFISSYRSSLLGANEVNGSNAYKLYDIKSNDSLIIKDDIDLGGITWTVKDVVNISITGDVEFYNAIGRYPKIYNFKIAGSEIDGIYYIGMFKTLDNSTITNINFADVTYNNVVETGTGVRAGILAGEVKSNSVVENVGIDVKSMNITLNSALNGKDIYVGGIAGINNGNISKSSVYSTQGTTKGNIKVSYADGVKANTYVGGIAGAMMFASAKVGGSKVKSIAITVANTSNGSLGGIVGDMQTGTNVESCLVNNVEVEGAIAYSEKASSGLIGHYEGGIAGSQASESRILASAVNGARITGFVAGGIVGSTFGNVENCYTNIDITAYKAGGVAGYQQNDSIIRDVRVDGSLACTNVSFDLGSMHSGDAVKAGVSAIAYGTETQIPKMVRAFVNCTFANDGKDSYKVTSSLKDNAAMVRLNMGWIYSGVEENIVINKDKANGAKDNQKADSPLDFLGDLIAQTTYDVYETNNADLEAKKYEVFTSKGYEVATWDFSKTGGPQVKAVNDVLVEIA